MRHPFGLLSAILFTLGTVSCGGDRLSLPVAHTPGPLVQISSEAGVAHASRKVIHNMFDVFDKNQDGKLDSSEIKIPLLIRLLDRNHDKVLTPDELQHPLALKAVSYMLKTTAAKMYKVVDRNADGKIEYSEFKIASDMDNKLTKLIFHLTDNSFDDLVDPSEYEDFIGQAIAVGGEGLGNWPLSQPLFQEAVK